MWFFDKKEEMLPQKILFHSVVSHLVPSCLSKDLPFNIRPFKKAFLEATYIECE